MRTARVGCRPSAPIPPGGLRSFPDPASPWSIWSTAVAPRRRLFAPPPVLCRSIQAALASGDQVQQGPKARSGPGRPDRTSHSIAPGGQHVVLRLQRFPRADPRPPGGVRLMSDVLLENLVTRGKFSTADVTDLAVPGGVPSRNRQGSPSTGPRVNQADAQAVAAGRDRWASTPSRSSDASQSGRHVGGGKWPCPFSGPRLVGNGPCSRSTTRSRACVGLPSRGPMIWASERAVGRRQSAVVRNQRFRPPPRTNGKDEPVPSLGRRNQPSAGLFGPKSGRCRAPAAVLHRVQG